MVKGRKTDEKKQKTRSTGLIQQQHAPQKGLKNLA